MTRRQFLRAIGVSMVSSTCSRGRGHSNRAPPGSITGLTLGASMLSVLGTGADAPVMNAGKNRFGFVLVNLQNQAIVGGTPHVWLAPDETSSASGPFPATWHPFTAYEATGDQSPASPLPGEFAADID